MKFMTWSSGEKRKNRSRIEGCGHLAMRGYRQCLLRTSDCTVSSAGIIRIRFKGFSQAAIRATTPTAA
jgi:hypothetical protein